MGDNHAPDWDSALARARAHAPFLARALERQPDLAALLAAGDAAGALAWARALGENPDTEVALRRERLAVWNGLSFLGLLAAAVVSWGGVWAVVRQSGHRSRRDCRGHVSP
jgi:glutamate-ammonia-ligase adenylyltransferase